MYAKKGLLMVGTVKKQFSVSTLYKIIFWLVIAAMLGLWSLPGLMKKTGKRSEIAWGTINGKTIFRSDFDRKVLAFEEQLYAMRAQYGQYTDQLMESMGIIANPNLLAYDALVREILLDDVAQELQLNVHSEYAQEALSNIVTAYQELGDLIPMDAIDIRNGTIQEKALRRHLHRIGLSMSDFDQKIEQALARKMVRTFISNAAYSPVFEGEIEYSARFLPKTFSVMIIPKSEIVAEVKKDLITDTDLQAFFDRKNKNQDAYLIPEKRSVKVWSITPHTYGIAVSDDEINRYYEENKEKKFVADVSKVQVRKLVLNIEKSDVNATLEQAKQLRDQLITKPADFVLKVKELSVDQHDGLMKPFAKGDTSIDPKLERAAFLLKNKGDISEPIVVNANVILLQLVEKTPKTYKSLATVKKDIIDTLTHQKFGKHFVRDMKEVYKDKDDMRLKEMIAQKGGSVAVKQLIINNGSPLAQAAFDSTVNEYAFYVDNKEGYIVQVTDIQAKHLPNLDGIRDTVRNDLIEDRAAALLRSRVAQAKEAVQKQSFSEVAKQYKAHVKKTGPVDSTNETQVAALGKEGLPSYEMLQIEKAGMITTALNSDHGYVIRLDEVAPLKKEEFEAKQQTLSDQLNRSRMMVITQGFVASLHRNATINLNS